LFLGIPDQDQFDWWMIVIIALSAATAFAALLVLVYLAWKWRAWLAYQKWSRKICEIFKTGASKLRLYKPLQNA